MKFYEQLQNTLILSPDEILAMNSEKGAVDAATVITYLDVKTMLKDNIDLRYQNTLLINAINVVILEMTDRNI
jgi:hypothetical protein